MKMKVTEVPNYPEFEVVGKTTDSTTGTIDRKPIGRALITTEDLQGKKLTPVDGDGTVLKQVTAIDKEAATELFIELVGGTKSAASRKFFGGYTAENTENAGVKELYTTEVDKINGLVNLAHKMCEVHPESDDQWKIVDKDGNTWYIRTIATDLTACGKVSCR